MAKPQWRAGNLKHHVSIAASGHDLQAEPQERAMAESVVPKASF